MSMTATTTTVTPEGLALLKGTKQFLVEQKFVRTDFDLDDWIVAQP